MLGQRHKKDSSFHADNDTKIQGGFYVKKVISMLLSLIMSFGVFMIIPVTTTGALDGISYIDANGKLQTADSVTEMTSNSTALTAGWYAVTSDTEISSRITCTGNVHLILSDDYT